MPAHLAVAIVADNPAQALDLARSLPPQVSLVEYRLDMMSSPDVALLAAQTPLPAIFTCRPLAQGGRFEGPEAERRAILKQALKTGHLVDIEMDTLAALAQATVNRDKIIGSWHDFEGMPENWAQLEREMRASGAGIAKLVGMAQTEKDVLPPLAWLNQATGPAIAIAMGAAGVATRLLAPRFDQAFLTFASLAAASAPGQVHVTELINRYGYAHLADADPLLVMLTPDPVPWEQVAHYRQAMQRRFARGNAWLLPIPVAAVRPNLLAALRLARVLGVFRLPQTPLAPDLPENTFAWRLTSQPAERLSDLPDADTLMTFFQGA